MWPSSREPVGFMVGGGGPAELPGKNPKLPLEVFDSLRTQACRGVETATVPDS